MGKQEDAASTNDKLKLLVSAADKLVSKHINKDVELTKELIKPKTESVITEREVDIDEIKTKNNNQDFIKYFEWYLDFYRQHPRPKTKKQYNKGTLKTLRNTNELLERFQKNKRRLKFDEITLNFHQKLLSYMSENDYSMNYKGIKISGLTESVNIKITDIEGDLVAEAQSNINLRSSNANYNFATDGGTAIWNDKNLENSVVRTGVYLVMISDLESFETKVIKVLVVR